MIKSLALIFFLALTQATFGQTADVRSRQDQYLMAYLKIQEADQFEKAGHLREAYYAYLQVKELLVNLHKTHPEETGEFVPTILRITKTLDALKEKITERHTVPHQNWRARPAN